MKHAHKTLLHRLFGAGRVPKGVMAQIEQEGILLQDEGIGGSITFRNFRGPGRRHGWKRSWFTGSIVLTKETFLAFNFSNPVIGIPWSDEKLKELNCSLENENVLCVQYDASTFNDEWSGDIEVRFRTPLAAQILEVIEGIIV